MRLTVCDAEENTSDFRGDAPSRSLSNFLMLLQSRDIAIWSFTLPIDSTSLCDHFRIRHQKANRIKRKFTEDRNRDFDQTIAPVDDTVPVKYDWKVCRCHLSLKGGDHEGLLINDSPCAQDF